MTGTTRRILSGSDALDNALGGGFPAGYTVLVEGPQGVGSTEFALTLLRSLARQQSGPKALYLTALRSPERVHREAADLFDDEKAAHAIQFLALRPGLAQADCLNALGALKQGDCLVFESVGALMRTEVGRDLPAFLSNLAEIAAQAGVLLIILHATGTVDAVAEAAIHEIADAILTFTWRDGGQSKRRALTITKLRGLGPGLDGEQVPIFEATLRNGTGFSVARVKSVV